MKTLDGEQLHKWYLEATKELHPESYNPKAQKPYSELTDEQKFIDKYIAQAILKHLREVAEGMKNTAPLWVGHKAYNKALQDFLERMEKP